MASFEMHLGYIEAQLRLEHERHVQLSALAAQAAASALGSNGRQRLQHELNKAHQKQLKLLMLELPALLAHRQAGGSVDDLIRFYSMVEDQLDALAATL